MSDNAVCAGENGGTAEHPADEPDPIVARPPTDHVRECASRTFGRVWQVNNPGTANLVKLADKAFANEALPAYAYRALEILIRRIAELTEEIGSSDQELRAWHAGNEASRRLAAIPSIGVITATAIAALP